MVDEVRRKKKITSKHFFICVCTTVQKFGVSKFF